MPTPTRYKQLAGYLRRKRVPLWLFFSVGAGLVVLSVLINQTTPYKPPQGIVLLGLWLGVLIAFNSWILICVRSWFQEDDSTLSTEKAARNFSRFFGARGQLLIILEWYASLTLTLMFAACIVASISLLWSEILKPILN